MSCAAGPAGPGGARAAAGAAGPDRVNGSARPVLRWAAPSTASALGTRVSEGTKPAAQDAGALLFLGLSRRDLRVQGLGEEVGNFARSFLPGHS